MIKSFNNFYRQLFQGQLFVIKAGGRVISDNNARESLLKNILELTRDGIQVLLIYGGGSMIDEHMKLAGLKPKKIDGRRITSEKDIAVVKSVLSGNLGFRVSETMARIGLHGCVLNGLPPDWADIQRRPKMDNIVRFDGTVSRVHGKRVRTLVGSANFVACPCLGILKEGASVNINADNAAVSLASGCKSAKLILLTDVDGIQVNGKVADVLTRGELMHMIEDGTITDGMRVKAENCIRALESDVSRVHILNGFRKNVLRDEIYTSGGAGTMIVRKKERKVYEKELHPEDARRKKA